MSGALLAVALSALAGLPPESPPVNVVGFNSTAYTLYAETFPGRCWGERVNAAIAAAVGHGNGSAEIVLPTGDLNVSVPIRFATNAPGCDGVANTRSIVTVWGCVKGATQSDLPRGLTLRGVGGTTGNVFEGGTRLVWVGPPDSVMVEMPAPWHCHVTRVALHGSWVPRVTGIRYRAGWEYGTNGGKNNLFSDLVFTGLDTGLQIGDPLSPDLVNAVVSRVDCYGARQCVLLYGANVAEVHLSEFNMNQFVRAGFLVLGTSGRTIRTAAQRKASPAVPAAPDGTPTVLTDVDEASEIVWEELPPFARAAAPAVIDKPAGPTGGAKAGGGGPSFDIRNVVASSEFCASWLVDSNGAAVRLQSVRNEGCNGLYRNNGTSWTSNTRTRFNDLLVDVSSCTSAGSDGNVVTYGKEGPLTVVGGSFHGPVATKAKAVVFNLGANFDNWNKSDEGCVLRGDEWMLGVGSPYVVTDDNCTGGAVWAVNGAPGRRIVAPVPSQRNPPAVVGFTALADGGGGAADLAASAVGPSVRQAQEAYSGTAVVDAGAGVANVTLPRVMSCGARYQVFLTPAWNAGAVWVANRTAAGFVASVATPPLRRADIDWHVRTAPWEGTPEPLCCG